MYPLATYLREIRQDWPLHAIQTALADLDHAPYERVAIGALRTALDAAAAHPREIRKNLDHDARRRTPAPAQLCLECHRPHDPARPGEHVAAPSPDAVRRGAALVRDAIRAARTPKPEEASP